MGRRLLVVCSLALFHLACPGPTPTPDAGTGGGSGGGFVPGAGGGSGGGTGGVANVEQYCDAVASRFCDEYISCNLAESSWKADCVVLFGGSFCADLKQSVQNGEQSFDTATAGTCVAELQNKPSDCDNFGSIFGSNCGSVSTGLVPAGGQCNSYSDCAGSSGCSIPSDAGSECDGKCGASTGATGNLGQPCYGTTVTSCYSPYWCDVSVNTCKDPKGSGLACTNARECNSDNYCNTTTQQCTALPSAGQPCNLSAYPYCNSSAYCQFGATNTCVAKGGAGATCANSSQCQSTMSCFNGQCRQKATEGGSCKNYDDCATSFSCDDITRTCARFASVPAGSQCTNTKYCSGSWCNGARSNPDGGIGTQGTCSTNYTGRPCSSQYTCQNATTCVGADAGVSGTCQASTTGSRCEGAYNCPSTAYCNDLTNLCAARSGPGSSCVNGQDESCTGGYRCIAVSPDAGTGQCGIPGSAGTACFVGGVNQCKIPNDCISGSCTPVGKSGLPCFTGGYCFDGACVGYDASTGARGTCGAKLPDGQSCREDYECTSGQCDAQSDKCSSVCQ